MVKNRIAQILPDSDNRHWNRHVVIAHRVLKSKRFKSRVNELRQLEGVYSNPSFPEFPIHISCRFNDLLRCSDTDHFTSCFRVYGAEKLQPLMRCLNPNWAIIYVTDKAGTIMGRCWLSFTSESEIRYLYGPRAKDQYHIYRLYGNKLGVDDVYKIIEEKLLSLYIENKCHDFKLNGGEPDRYLSY